MYSELLNKARQQLAALKKIMEDYKESAVHPLALLVLPDGTELLVILEWRTEQEQAVVLERLRDTVKLAGATAVIMFGTATTLVLEIGTEPVQFLFATIHTPDAPPYTMGQTYSMVEGHPIFGTAYNSGDKVITPWQIPPFWGTGYTPGTTIQ